MDETLKTKIFSWLEGRVDAAGFAPVERFHEAPAGHHPTLVCKDAATVIVFGRRVPKGVLNSPEYGLYLLHRSYHTLYPYLDEVAMDLANRVEAQGYLAVQVPSFAPVVYHGEVPWGLLSLKHAAVFAGLGALGRNGLFFHTEHGSLLRLAAVITNAKIPGDPVIDASCPRECNACQEACPAGAFQNGVFNKAVCLAYSIRHAIYPLALRDARGRKNIETIFNTAGYNAWIRCHDCQKACPNNQMNSRA
ncbi:MAG: 4Fe-4S double cluster binding domain-containing protein [Pseudomonadota bacterium]